MCGFVFRDGDAKRWHRLHGTAAHPHDFVDVYGIDPAASLEPLRPSTAMATGLYVVVDDDSVVQYIGKVCRTDPSAIRERFADHHARTDDWPGVWLLPLRDDCDDTIVTTFEALMIRAWRPAGNTHHNSRGAR